METAPELPIPVSLIGGRYLLFSIDAVTYLRREHHICGVLIGSIPQAPQQNVFLGLPLELMLEEVRLLVEKRVAYIVDDAVAHQLGVIEAPMQRRYEYVSKLQNTGRQAALSQTEVREQSRAKALAKSRSTAIKKQSVKDISQEDDEGPSTPKSAHEELIFTPPNLSEPAASDSPPVSTFGVTPATSTSLLTPPPPPNSSKAKLPTVPASYPLFKHLYSKKYFVSPGLRFGCKYLVYPGDPLRFHSHFLATHTGWDEEIDLMDLVGGGRLGTGVKKGYLIGGLERKEKEGGDESAENVRTFSIEWAVM
jgi:tRNA-splicing endonuclease subunit Sen34